MFKTKFITAIYSDLNGTEFGGRIGRNGHYRYSLLSLLKMSNADFLCYTSDRELESLENFFYKEHQIPKELLEFKVFDIGNTKFKELINQNKNIDVTKKSDRCVEIQYSKFHWWWDEIDVDRYAHYYWIDSGLSHCGLIPNKYLPDTGQIRRFYESTVFDNDFLKNLVEFTGDNFFIIAKDNVRNYWSGTVDPKWYVNYDNSRHIIGGLFGGKTSIWDNIVNMFESYLKNILEVDGVLPHEENIMSLMFANHSELFSPKYFDIWWCKDNCPSGLPDDFFEKNKSFYHILEELMSPTKIIP